MILLPMHYRILDLNRLRPELRDKYLPHQTIAALCENGDRTATTRRKPPGLSVGDAFGIQGVDGVYRVTGFRTVDLETPEGREDWSRREGWSVESIPSFGGQVRTGAIQMRFKRVNERKEG